VRGIGEIGPHVVVSLQQGMTNSATHWNKHD
jgi:hypothetical protein